MDRYEMIVKPAWESIRAFLCAGGAERDLPARLNLSAETLRRYRKKYPEFETLLAECRKCAAELADDQVEAALFRRATGYDVGCDDAVRHVPADVKAAVFWLKNRRPDAWRDRRNVVLEEPVKITFSAEEKEL
ncbi:MAG: hypothetical protein MJ016_00125 [Victivallaceae bacterium]|nr:hypothetical protein [Victivallaceae bacterium]